MNVPQTSDPEIPGNVMTGNRTRDSWEHPSRNQVGWRRPLKKKKKKASLKLSKRSPHDVKSQTPTECGAVGSQGGLPGPE